MLLTRLRVRHFRNLGEQELCFPPEGVAILGENAQGKSNLLEAIYYLETFRSFRGGRDEQLVSFDEETFRVVAELDGTEGEERGLEVAAAFQRRGKRKKITVDGTEPPRLGDALGSMAAVVFSPADVAVVNEGPGARRRFLDIVLSLNQPGYLGALQRFRHVLAQRNAALRAEQPTSAVRAWDEHLVSSGTEVLKLRGDWTRTWTDTFSDFHAHVSGGQAARLSHRPGLPTLDPDACGELGTEEIAGRFRDALCGAADRERRTGSTAVGPQRDELRITLEGDGGEIDVRDFGSGGQRRTAALALRLTEAETVRRARGREPLVLLDDVFAELDDGRSGRILELIGSDASSQVVLTAPKESEVRVRKDTLSRWRISGGVVHT